MFPFRKSNLILVIFLLLFLVGCNQQHANVSPALNPPPRFSVVYDWVDHGDITTTGERVRIIVDRETKVMYFFDFRGRGAGLTVMVDANGKPLLWDGPLAEVSP